MHKVITLKVEQEDDVERLDHLLYATHNMYLRALLIAPELDPEDLDFLNELEKDARYRLKAIHKIRKEHEHKKE